MALSVYICLSLSLLITIVLVLILVPPASIQKNNHHYCPPSSCGNIPNISYPFRLTSDPPKCGDQRYELSCDDNNHTLLYLHGSKYYVSQINYDNYTIRIVDAGIREDNYSFIPRYFLNRHNLSWPDSDLYPYLTPYDFRRLQLSEVVVIVKCEKPISWDSSFHSYTTSTSCSNINNRSGSSSNSSLSQYSKQYIYLNLGANVMNVEESCAIEQMSLTSWPGLIDADHPIKISPSCTDLSNFFSYGRVAINVLGAPFMIAFLIYKWRRRHLSMYDNIEKFLQSQNDFMPIRYSFSEIKKITKGFRERLGEGGYGTVFKGTLRSGHLVVVKMLSQSKANGQDFINEVATIGRIHHVNIVQLIGFCVHGSKRALIYEFMPNGSLNKHIFSSKKNILNYEKTYDIALGVARGIEYLHQGCDMQILHFDIKPHNILLDENLKPKVSDFGLAKLYPVEDSIVPLTHARGTFGYMAPEMLYKNIGGISYKADVYSFGMLFMEMASRRKNLNAFTEHLSQIYFPTWIYDQFHDGKNIEIQDATEDERKTCEKMMIVALWCIQLNPRDRPSMNEVIKMLEGDVECLQVPLKPLQPSPKREVKGARDNSNQASSSIQSDESRLI
ncbi:hypothetical protein I3842_08G121500 [Carya illinoinensis]|uniref:Protein kinase domain-containing protein n=1 Tax=Carya illinoinensis TaxID=32201 RepID=A0A922EEF3_CARIL|nr:hypothetical protein I3842_08G121500 [Carya illinoinensis]